LRIKIDGKLAKATVSRGQGKLIVAAIIGAQARFLREHTMEVPILLVDDLAAELDRTAREVAADYLLSTQAQIFFTAIERSDLPGELCQTARMFHVEHGNVRAVAPDR
jgi:DNA replication and repair protein RecF